MAPSSHSPAIAHLPASCPVEVYLCRSMLSRSRVLIFDWRERKVLDSFLVGLSLVESSRLASKFLVRKADAASGSSVLLIQRRYTFCVSTNDNYLTSFCSAAPSPSSSSSIDTASIAHQHLQSPHPALYSRQPPPPALARPHPSAHQPPTRPALAVLPHPHRVPSPSYHAVHPSPNSLSSHSPSPPGAHYASGHHPHQNRLRTSTLILTTSASSSSPLR